MSIKVQCSVCGRETTSANVQYVDIFNGRHGLVCKSCINKFGFKPLTNAGQAKEVETSQTRVMKQENNEFTEWDLMSYRGNKTGALRNDEVSVVEKKNIHSYYVSINAGVAKALLLKDIVNLRVLSKKDGTIIFLFSKEGGIKPALKNHTSGHSLCYYSATLSKRLMSIYGVKEEDRVVLRISKDLSNSPDTSIFQILGRK